MHFSPDCKSVSRAAGGSHRRNEGNGYLGDDSACQDYNKDLGWILEVVTNQMKRPGNSLFKFTIEAPVGIISKHPTIKMIEMPVADGGRGGKRCEVHYCKFGLPIHKPTYLWTNIPSVIADLPTDERRPHPWLCRAGNQCFLGEGNHKQLGTGRPGGACSEAAAFPHDLVNWLVQHVVNRGCAERRTDDVKA